MGFMDSVKETIFGEVNNNQASTLTSAQKDLLKQLGGLNQKYNPQSYSVLSGLAYNPQSSYQYNADNGAAAFQSGIVDPAMNQLDKQIADTKHSSMLHSSANRMAQDTLKQNTMDNINNLKYQDQIKQQQLKQQAQENSYSRQLSSLQQLLSGNSQVLGTQGIQNYQTPTGGLLDIISAGGQAAGGIGALMKVI